MARVIEDSWLQEYLRFTAGLQSPELFHLWTGISTIAAALERNVVLDRVYFKVYPNMYIVLVGPPGKVGKNTAINMGSGLLANLDDAPRFFAEKITPERILDFMSGGMRRIGENRIKFVSAAYACAPELNVFLGKSQDGDTLKLLTDLYDCKEGTWRYETKSSGVAELENPCLNMLAGSTPKWLRTSIPIEIVGGGFISRTIFVYQDTPRRPVAFPEDEVPDNYEDMQRRLLNDLNHIRELEGVFKFTDSGKQWYGEFYEEFYYTSHETHDTDFYARWPTQLLKLGMIVSIAERDDLTLTDHDLRRARAMLDAVSGHMKGVSELMSSADSEISTTKILGFIRRRSTITHRELSQYSSKYCKSDELNRIIQTLIDAGEIQIVHVGPRGGRKYRYIPEEEREQDGEE